MNRFGETLMPQSILAVLFLLLVSLVFAGPLRIAGLQAEVRRLRATVAERDRLIRNLLRRIEAIGAGPDGLEQHLAEGEPQAPRGTRLRLERRGRLPEGSL